MTESSGDQTIQSATIHPFDDLESLYASVADAFCQVVDHAVEQRGVARISLSGGSTPKRLYEVLADRNLPWTKIHWFWGDERNVPADHADSNQKMVRQAMFSRVPVSESHLHPVLVDVDSPSATAHRYEQCLREHFVGDKFPRWDLVLLGLGDDAHTASLFPHTKALREQTRWFVENHVPKLDTYRYTLTAPAISSALECWFLVAGKGKLDAVGHVWDGPPNPSKYPSQLVRATRWFLTSDANPRR